MTSNSSAISHELSAPYLQMFLLLPTGASAQ